MPDGREDRGAVCAEAGREMEGAGPIMVEG